MQDWVKVGVPCGLQIISQNGNFIVDEARICTTLPNWERDDAVRIISGNTILSFAAMHPNAAASLEHWFYVTKAGAWVNAGEVQATFSKAKVLNAERVRFAIAGGDYRLIVAFDFGRGIAFVKFIGTHAEYDRIDALTVSLH